MFEFSPFNEGVYTPAHDFSVVPPSMFQVYEMVEEIASFERRVVTLILPVMQIDR
ncbi:hypothetical protein [Geomicrobium sp. JCM 19039]|uniref:hypothetical protein n=1 Tax=Geomicrobium sp. JCM 19039 TaxID=1460636 RepID=UPI00045F28F9|nr:hypothetical protein [Geomicrobium sp. JCM 19039]GAK10585.1 hypothetical protein JCM19039_210 [Geomicrobium sp. JCM 19039]